METINLYGEDGIAVYVTAELDICEPRDGDAEMRIIGHRAYASSVDEAERAIVAEYKRRTTDHAA